MARPCSTWAVPTDGSSAAAAEQQPAAPVHEEQATAASEAIHNTNDADATAAVSWPDFLEQLWERGHFEGHSPDNK